MEPLILDKSKTKNPKPLTQKFKCGKITVKGMGSAKEQEDSTMSSGGYRPGAGRPRKPLVMEAGRSAFTLEQREVFEESPYVASTTEKTISFTREFKELFWQRYRDGVSPEKIFVDAGFDPKMVGVSRIWGLVTTLRKQKEQGMEFSDGRPSRLNAIPSKPPRLPNVSQEAKNAAEIDRLNHAVAYLTQQMEFIKKIILAANGGESE